ncbi:MAG: cytochrome c3 family protein [Dehalococcoidales bacterium]|nr:cytochrome c3 family protein [Dehalococcoidales bacterium]
MKLSSGQRHHIGLGLLLTLIIAAGGLLFPNTTVASKDPAQPNSEATSHFVISEANATATPTASLEGNAACLSCHGINDFHLELANGDTLSLYVDNSKLMTSTHAGLLCTNCHSTISGYPHPKVDAVTRREYSLALYEACKQCHFENYTKTLDGMHYTVLANGDMNAPVCVDCHGFHDVQKPAEPRSRISQTCAPCHQTAYNQYALSVHGAALIQDNNLDVPVCTDCHITHGFKDPRTPAFRFESVDICSKCHGNAQLMEKYGISTSVVKTYLQDFHGATVSLAAKGNKDIWVDTAVCTDCHGVHNIESVSASDSPVIKANLLHVCQKCHPDATTNFPAAWLSHYEPSPKQAILVFLIRRFYWILIPFIVIGLLAHIFIELRRKVKNRNGA